MALLSLLNLFFCLNWQNWVLSYGQEVALLGSPRFKFYYFLFEVFKEEIVDFLFGWWEFGLTIWLWVEDGESSEILFRYDLSIILD